MDADTSVLLVEDDAAQARFIQAVLSKSFEVDTADRLSKALEKLSSDHYDVVVLDLGLPDSDGIDTLAAVQIVAASIPVIVLTGMEGDDVAHLVLRRGAQDFIEKAELNLNLLARAIRHAIDRKRLEDQLLQAQKLEAVGELSAGIAHEFNNLLQSIRGYTKFASDEIPSDTQPYRDLQNVIKAADDAACLTKQLLCFGRRNPLQRQLVDPNTAIQQQIEMLRPLIGERIDLQVDLQADLHQVHVDATEMQQMVMNLCINSRDAMPEGGDLTIRTESTEVTDAVRRRHQLELKPGTYVMLSVIDTGQGMSAEIQQRMFEPFFTTKEVGKGTGMGMAMVYGAMQQHGGAVTVASAPGEGTKVQLYFPAAADDESAGSGPARILIAEDNAMVRDLAVRILHRAGYETLIANDGAEAIELLEEIEFNVDLALLDVVMPKMSGREVFETAASRNPNIRFVFCTGYDPNGSETDFVDERQWRLVRKPFTRESLLDAVRATLEARELAAV
ncbi:MAG: response regulator [Pirellulaceae bacterium]|nr:response regulator [Pirellulaceae bacterium]